MVDHGVKHQPKLFANFDHIVPRAQIRIYGPVVDNRKTVVRRVGKKRQNMDDADGAGNVFLKEMGQSLQWGLTFCVDHVAVGDEDAV